MTRPSLPLSGRHRFYQPVCCVDVAYASFTRPRPLMRRQQQEDGLET